MQLRRCALAAALIALLPLSARAASITENFTLSVPVGTTLSSGANSFSVTSFAEFNPALGTLNRVSVTLAGAAVWSANTFPDAFTDNLILPFNTMHFLTSGQLFDFDQSGSIVIDLSSGPIGDAPDLSHLTGTGMTNLDLLVEAKAGDNFFTPVGTSLAGSITYSYTPAAVPGPSSLALFGAGLTGLAFLRRKPRRQAAAGQPADRPGGRSGGDKRHPKG